MSHVGMAVVIIVNFISYVIKWSKNGAPQYLETIKPL